jgi:uncharacterized protein
VVGAIRHLRAAARKMTVTRNAPAQRFDALDLAARGDALAGKVDAAKRVRVADRLAPTSGEATIEWRIVGAHDALDRPMLVVTVEGDVPLLCQRCLQTFDEHVAQRSELLLARDDAELKRLDAEEREVVLAATPLDSMTLVEDELLLSLPYAPRHPEGKCAPGARVAAAETAQKVSPFAQLAALKRGDGRNT